jgi:choloylglycine hydrolase
MAVMCTTLRIVASDDTVLVGRTMEYSLPVNWEWRAVPRGVRQVSTAPGGAGAPWTGTHGYVGIGSGRTTVFGHTLPALPSVSDGVNEAGLYAGLLYLPTFAEYESPLDVPANRLLAPVDVAAFALATSATVAEAVTAVESMVVWPAAIPVVGVPPLHLILHDRSGASAVVDWVAGERHVYDNPIGVATNSPPLDWHLTNLRNYVNQTAMDVPELSLEGQTIHPLGQGTGMLGLPGDFTPPSRFVRAVAFSAAARTPPTAADGVCAVMHLLSSFDITKGVIRDSVPEGLTGPEVEAAELGDYTSFSAVSELNGRPAYTVRTYDDASQRRLALDEVDLSAGPPRSLPMVASAPVAISF